MSRPDHPIFHEPLPVDLQIEQTPTPPGYPDYELVDEVPPTLPTIAVLTREWDPLNLPVGAWPDGGEPGLVTSGAGFLDSPDTESITGGIHLKGPSYVAIGRQGPVLQWGFYGTPEEMTETGRRMFVNAIHYIDRFKDDPVLVLREKMPRESLATTLGFLARYEGERRDQVLARTFGEQVPDGLSGDRAAMREWYQAHEPYLTYEGPLARGRYVIDQDAREVGISNRDVRLLDWSVENLAPDRDSERARRLLERYTDQRLQTSGEWRTWLADNREHLFFTDWGGYRFRSVRQAAPPTLEVAAERDPVRLELLAYRRGEEIVAQLKVRIDPEFHIYAQTRKDPAMIPFDVRLPEGSPFELTTSPVVPVPRDGEISGHFTVETRLKGEGDNVVLAVDYQACTEQFCLPPVNDAEVAAALPRPRPAA